MPVYLPPISRRDFIKRSAVVAAAALASGCVSTRPTRDSRSWALLSDIHIAADPNHIERQVNMTANLRKVLQEVGSWHARPSNMLVNGDLAFNNGELGDYEAILGLLQSVREDGLPIYLGLGNHDSREHFWHIDPADKKEDLLAGRQVMIVRGEEANWFILDSLVQTRHTPGLLGQAQLDWLATSLDQNADRPAIVAVHHNPLPGSAPDKSSLQDTEQFLAVLRPRRQVKVYFFGHTHNWHVSQDSSGLHLVNLPPTAYVFEPGRPSGWVAAMVRRDGIRLELRCLDRSHPQHGEVANLQWRV